jgi:hypothetical protein
MGYFGGYRPRPGDMGDFISNNHITKFTGLSSVREARQIAVLTNMEVLFAYVI